MNSFFGSSVVEKLKFTSFDEEKKAFIKKNDQEEDVTNKKYLNKINDVKNEKIKKSLLNLTKVFRQK